MSDVYDHIKQIACAVLSLIDPRQPYGTALFDAIARVSVSVCIEAVCLRINSENNNAIEVMLLKRSDDDTAYPGQLHSPGTVMRSGESIRDMFDRLGRTEIQS